LSLEPSFHVEICSDFLFGVNPARNVEPNETIHERSTYAGTTHWTTGITEVATIASPAHIVEHDRSESGAVSSKLDVSQPERITEARPCGLTAHRLTAAEVPESLHWYFANRAAGSKRQRCIDTLDQST
jgi:hypothetical protein